MNRRRGEVLLLRAWCGYYLCSPNLQDLETLGRFIHLEARLQYLLHAFLPTLVRWSVLVLLVLGSQPEWALSRLLLPNGQGVLPSCLLLWCAVDTGDEDARNEEEGTVRVNLIASTESQSVLGFVFVSDA